MGLTPEQIQWETMKAINWSNSDPKGAKVDHDRFFRNWLANVIERLGKRRPAPTPEHGARMSRAEHDARRNVAGAGGGTPRRQGDLDFTPSFDGGRKVYTIQ